MEDNYLLKEELEGVTREY